MNYIAKKIENQFSLYQNYHWLFFFLSISVFLRFFSFFPSLLGHDESTYMIIGRDILNGKKLYTDVFDNKPVGIFLFYAGMESLFGNSIFMKRLIFAIVVGLTAHIIYLISKKLFQTNRVALASGIIYVFYTSVWNYHGRSPNTEILFNFFTIAGLWFFLSKKNLFFFSGGLSIGIGFMVKYLVLLDLFAFMVYFFLLEMMHLKRGEFHKVFIRYFLAASGFLLPFVLTNLYFFLGTNFDDFVYVTYEMPRNYAGSPSLKRYLIMILEFIGKFFPISFFIVYTLFRKNKGFKIPHSRLLAFWTLCVLIAIYLPGKEMSHYTIQLMLPLSLFAGFFFHPEFKKDTITQAIFSGKTGNILLAALVGVILFLGIKDDVIKPDYAREVAGHIQKDLQENDEIYVSNYEQIIYYLLDVDSPGKYVHSTLLFSPKHAYLPINREKEVERIINQKPRYVMVQRKNILVEKLIEKTYSLDATFRNNEILVYKRND